jgi:Flp pilus assembly pilin Flp
MKQAGNWNFLRDQTGSTAVEFALIALPLVLLTIGVVEVGRAIFTQQSLSYAVDHAVRELYIDKDLIGIDSILDPQAIKSDIVSLSFLIDPEMLDDPVLVPTPLQNGSSAFRVVELRVSYTFESIVADWVFDMIPMNFTRTIVIEN